MNISTKTGDKGTTLYKPGQRVSKSDERLAFVGGIDELQVTIGGILHNRLTVRDQLVHIQKKLFDIHSGKLGPEDVRDIEKWQEQLMAEYSITFDWNLTTPKTFNADYARVTARRLERMYYKIDMEEEKSESVMQYLNRLSDYLWVVGRTIESKPKKEA